MAHGMISGRSIRSKITPKLQQMNFEALKEEIENYTRIINNQVAITNLKSEIATIYGHMLISRDHLEELYQMFP